MKRSLAEAKRHETIEQLKMQEAERDLRAAEEDVERLEREREPCTSKQSAVACGLLCIFGDRLSAVACEFCDLVLKGCVCVAIGHMWFAIQYGIYTVSAPDEAHEEMAAIEMQRKRSYIGNDQYAIHILQLNAVFGNLCHKSPAL